MTGEIVCQGCLSSVQNLWYTAIACSIPFYHWCRIFLSLVQDIVSLVVVLHNVLPLSLFCSLPIFSRHLVFDRVFFPVLYPMFVRIVKRLLHHQNLHITRHRQGAAYSAFKDAPATSSSVLPHTCVL